jgi:SAM-dependent methyltransferase
VSAEHGHWPRIASSWSLVGPPLRPAGPDLAAFNRVIGEWHAHAGRPPSALILGVTAEFFTALSWPRGTLVAALDGSPDMIAAVWPGPAELAMVGSWTAMPCEDASRDITLCDGGFGLLSLHDQQNLLAEVARVLAPGGVFVVRLFAPMGRTGTVEEVARDLRAHQVASLDQLKLRLWGALQTSAATGVRPRDVVERIHAMSDMGRFLVDELGWNRDHVDRLGVHRASTAVYHLTDEHGLARMLKSVPALECLSVERPTYAFGDACPVVTLRRR